MKNFEFTGNGWEYFKIWIVNILLTIVTLGIYYPWARVRNNKYFYANSSIEGRNFDYHATGKQLLIGYLVAIGVIFIYNLLNAISPEIGLILFIVFLIAVPWLILRSMKFNLNVTSFNNVRFKFNGQIKETYMIFLGLPIIFIIGFALGIFLVQMFKDSTALVILSVLLILALWLFFIAYFNTVTSRYFINYSDYGNSSFETDISAPGFIKIMLKSFLLSILVLLISGAVIALLGSILVNKQELMYISQMFQEDKNTAILLAFQMFLPILILFYLVLIVINIIPYAYYITRQRAYIYSNTKLDEEISFDSTMKFLPYAMILTTNFIMIILTLGLAYPWAKVRVARYTLANTKVDAQDGFDGYISKKEKESGFGDQMADTLDIDMGIPL